MHFREQPHCGHLYASGLGIVSEIDPVAGIANPPSRVLATASVTNPDGLVWLPDASALFVVSRTGGALGPRALVELDQNLNQLGQPIPLQNGHGPDGITAGIVALDGHTLTLANWVRHSARAVSEVLCDSASSVVGASSCRSITL